MTILSAQTIRERIWRAQNGENLPKFGGPTTYLQTRDRRLSIEPFAESKQACGMSYGLTSAGYDIRLGSIQHPRDPNKVFPNGIESWNLQPGEFLLAASYERLSIPNDLQAIVHDKSTLARQGIALQNTVLEPGWEGYITLELSNHGPKAVRILVGQPIAQVVFHMLDKPTDLPYRGKYQDQSAEPTPAKFVHEDDQRMIDEASKDMDQYKYDGARR